MQWIAYKYEKIHANLRSNKIMDEMFDPPQNT